MKMREVIIEENGLELKGILDLPEDSLGLIIFSHGSGSGRLSPRNNFVAKELVKSGLGTLLLDLLTPMEEQNRQNVFDIELLARRLILAKRWAEKQSNPESKPLKIGYFGASTGAAAALVAAAWQPENIFSVVSRGGRPDLAGESLEKVTAPTLLIVGGNDEGVIELNQAAYSKLVCEKAIKIVPNATHLFEEPGTLEAVAKLAVEWFLNCIE